MIHVTFVRRADRSLSGFMVTGHAGFAPYGQDVLCAGVSALVLNAINSIQHLTDTQVVVVSDEEAGSIKFKLVNQPSEASALLMQSLHLGLREIARNYGKEYITITYKEV